MTKAELMQEMFEEMKARLVNRLVNDQKLAEQASKDATDGNSQGVYVGYGQHAKELLDMVESMQEPEECSECEVPLFNPDRLYRFLCDVCGDKEYEKCRLMDRFNLIS